MKFCNFLSLLLLTSINCATGVVEISPSPVAPVCQEGDQLELTCNTTSGTDHRWEFTVISENVSYTRRPVSLTGVSGVPTTPLSIGASMVNFSRLSGPNVLPLISRITISPVSRGLNETVVSCFELATNLVATTTIQIIDSQQLELSIQSDFEYFSIDGVIVTLEWTLLNSQDYYQPLLRNVSVSANPQPKNIIIFTGNMRVQLELSYNTLYNVSVTQHSTCRQLNQTTILDLNFRKCSDPMELTNALSVGYANPALEGQIIMFICPHGQVLNGSNSSTCMGNGEWEPDPVKVECTSIPGTDIFETTTIATCSSPSYVLQISDPVRVIKDSPRQLEFDDTDTCCSGFLITSTNSTTCLENGEWKLDTSRVNCDCEGMIAVLRTALISVTCVLLVMSLFTFIAGIVYHRYISQKWRVSCNNNKSQNSPKDTESELELKENVAYITLRPAA